MGKDKAVKITKHGSKRLRKRQGCSKQSVEERAGQALKQGLPHHAVVGSLKKYLDGIWALHEGEYLVIFQGGLYVFGTPQGPLVTMWQLQGKQRQIASKQEQRWAEPKKKG